MMATDEKIIQVAKDKVKRFQEIEVELQDPQVVNDREKFRNLSKEFSELEKVKNLFETYQRLKKAHEEAAHVLVDESSDAELKGMAQHELDELASQEERLIEEFEALLIEKDPLFAKNAVIEVRAGTQGL